MPDMSLMWLRVSAVFYAVGLLRILGTVFQARRSEAPEAPIPPSNTILGTFAVAVVLHAVSLVERALISQRLPANNFFETMSLLGFLLAVVFLLVQWRYHFSSLGILLFPVVSLMTGIASTESPVSSWGDERVRGAWLVFHVLMILLGIVSVCLTSGASIFYLVQERRLKSKDLVSASRLPSLGVLDGLINRAMGIGFVFTTLGVLAGTTWAYIESGTRWLSNSNVMIAIFTWLFYLLMVFLRSNQGWRGRKTAFMALGLLGFSALTWVTHIGLGDKLSK
jgi:ABC-type transport system involved in cytochrome c biogenesis permease subunit